MRTFLGSGERMLLTLPATPEAHFEVVVRALSDSEQRTTPDHRGYVALAAPEGYRAIVETIPFVEPGESLRLRLERIPDEDITQEYLAQLIAAIGALRQAALDARLDPANEAHARLYGLTVGWSADVLESCCEKFGWSAEQIEQLSRWRGALESLVARP